MMQGTKYVRGFNIDDNNRARVIAEECIALEPDYFGNYVLYGAVHMMDYWLGYGGNPKKSLDTAIQFMEKALDLTDVSKGRVYPVLGYLYAMKKDYGRAIEVGEKGHIPCAEWSGWPCLAGHEPDHGGQSSRSHSRFSKKRCV
jgi:hypothetical protein